MRLDLNFLTLRFYVRLQLKNVFTLNMKVGGEIGGLQPFPIDSNDKDRGGHVG